MKTSIELKALAKRKMAPKLSPLVVVVVIYGAILVGLSIIVAIALTSNLIAQGVFESEESMRNYLMGQTSTDASVLDELMSYGIEIIIGALLTTLSVGLMNVCLKCARDEDITVSDMFSVYKMNPDRVIIIYLAGFAVKFVITLPTMVLSRLAPSDSFSVISALAILLDVIGLICQIAVTVLMSQAYFIYLDNPEQNSIESVKQSVLYMKNHFFGFLFLMVSFIPWYFVIIITFGVAAIWIVPYKYVTYALYYMNLKGELGGNVNVAI